MAKKEIEKLKTLLSEKTESGQRERQSAIQEVGVNKDYCPVVGKYASINNGAGIGAEKGTLESVFGTVTGGNARATSGRASSSAMEGDQRSCSNGGIASGDTPSDGNSALLAEDVESLQQALHQALEDFRSLNHEVQNLEVDHVPVEKAVKTCRQVLYCWKRIRDTKPATNPKKSNTTAFASDTNSSNNSSANNSRTRPTWTKPCGENIPQNIDIKEFVESQDFMHIVGVLGTDYGLKTLSMSVALLLEDAVAMVDQFRAQEKAKEVCSSNDGK